MRLIFYILSLLFIVQPVFASGIDSSLRINQNIYKPGEKVIANLRLRNNLASKHTVVIEANIRNESGSYSNLLPPLYEEFDMHSDKNIDLYNFDIDDSFENGEYLLTVNIFVQDKKVESLIQKFKIVNTLKNLDFKVDICKDNLCKGKTRVFTLDDTVYLNYSVEDVDKPQILASLIYPDKKIEQIFLPTSFRAEQVGNYELELAVSKSGYQAIETKEVFAVIKEIPKIESKSICADDGVCTKEERNNNCPEDCKDAKYLKQVQDKIEPTPIVSLKNIIFLCLALVVLIVIVVAYFYYKKNKKIEEL